MRMVLRSPIARPALVVLAAGLAGSLAAGCSSETSRYNDPFGNPFQSRNDVTHSTPQRSAAVESRPLPGPGQPQPNYSPPPNHSASPPRSVPASPAPTYRPQQASYSPAATGSVAPATRQGGGWRWDGGTAITVQPGETVDTIARRFGVPVPAILQANNIANPSHVQPGHRLVIPTYHAGMGGTQVVQANAQPQSNAQPRPSAPAYRPAQTHSPAQTPSGRIHVVNPGETLYSLGRRYGVSHAAIAATNGIHEQSLLRVGQRLAIPAPGSARTATASPPPSQVPARRAEAPAPEAESRVAAAPTAPQETAAAVTPVEAEPEITRTLGSSPQFRWPVRGRVISDFGPKANGQHNDGINLAVPEGTEVKAAESGVVAYAGNELKGYGNLVLIRHADGWMTAYAHNSQLVVKRGDNVRRGQTIARAGQTGGVTSPQLHFEIRRGSTPVNPTQYLAAL